METIKMKLDIPDWAKQRVTPMDHSFSEVSQLYRQGRAQIEIPDQKELKGWAMSNKWPTPWFGFKDVFIAKLFESNETFILALNKSGINIHIPIKEHTLTMATLKELDMLYEEREDMGILGRTPTDWGTLVRMLREIRHLVEAGIIIKVEDTDTVLNTWQSFYNWAHSRYHMLEDGSDSWIGDDNS